MNFETLAQQFSQQKAAFGVPGSGPTADLVEALSEQGVKVLVPGHEMTAALMAAGLSAATGEAGLCFSIKGPGFANLAPGLLCARTELRSVVAVTEAYPTNGSRRHKWMDHGQWSQQAAKQSLGQKDALSAKKIAESWPPSPVVVELVDRPESSQPTKEVAYQSLPSQWEQIRRPVLILGLGAPPCSEWLKNLRVPVFTTPAAKGLLDENHPFSGGVFTGVGKPPTPEGVLVPKSDGLIFVGVSAGELLRADFDERALFLSTRPHEQLFPPCSILPKTTPVREVEIERLLEGLSSRDWAQVAPVREYMYDALSEFGFTPASLQMAFDSSRPLTHVLDTGCFTVTGEHVLCASKVHRVIGAPNSRTMGAGIGLALGSACAGPTVLWLGDGGARSAGLELELAVQHSLPLLVLHLRDGGFGSIKMARATSHPAFEVRSSAAAWARGLGFEVLETGVHTEAWEVIEAWLQKPKPMFIDAQFHAESYRNSARLLR